MESAGQQIEAWFEVARQLTDPEARQAYLASVSSEHPELHAKVLELLGRYDRADAFFNAAAEAFDPAALGAQPAEQIGARIGRYRLVERVGQGGCGVVYAAEQEEPVRRRVALKVIKLGMDTASVVARFEAERQALASMEHPNIAKLLDGGATHTGRPYFVMEFVEGAKITDYCRQNRLTLGQRLGLFKKVCQALHHAHQKGIIHRDLKPSNILVATEGGQVVPKVIDFGIAKAMHSHPAAQTHFTILEQLLGTPAYMSPEQAAMSLDIDTRSDIYSLGVLFYELLTGKTPFETVDMAGGLDQLRRAIMDREPVRPSTMLRSMGKDDARQSLDGSDRAIPLPISIPPDLDWIVLKCLEKDRTRRYGSANEVSEEIQRHLNDEPISARPPSRLYRFQKFARRNKVLLGSGAAALAALALGTTVAIWQAAQATRAMKDALIAQAAEASLRRKAQAQSYTSDMSTAYQLWKDGDLKRARQLLDRHIPEAGQPDLRSFEWRLLDKLFRDESLPLENGEKIEQVQAILGCSNHALAVVCSTSAIRLINPSTRAVVGSLEYPNPNVETDSVLGSVAPGAPTVLALHHAEGLVGLYDLDQQSWQTIFRPLSGRLGAMTLSPDGAQLACAEGKPAIGRALALYALPGALGQAREPRLSWSNQCDVCPTVLKFSPDGRSLVGNAKTFVDGSIQAWDAQTGREQAPFPRRSVGYMNDLEFSPDGRWLASCGVEGTINIWDFAHRRILCSLEGHRGRVNSLAFSTDGLRLISGGDDGTIRIWDLSVGKCLGLVRDPLNRAIRSVAFASDNKTIVSSCGGELRFWNAAPSPIAETIQTGQELALPIVSPDSKWLVSREATVWTKTFNPTNALKVWDLATRRVKFHLIPENRQTLGILFSPDGRYFVSGGEDSNRVITVWETAGWGLLRESPPPVVLITNDFEAGSLAFSPNGRMLAVAGLSLNPDMPSGATNRLSLWQVGSWQKLNILPDAGRGPAERAAAGTVAFSPDSKSLAVGSRDGWLRLWDVNAQKLMKAARVFPGNAFGMGLSFSHDGRMLAAFEIGGTAVVFFDLTDFEHPRTLDKADTSSLWSGMFSPESRTFVTAGNDGLIKFWNLETLRVALTLEHSHGPHVFLAFSADGNLLVSTDSHGTMKLWPANPLSAGR
jgi:WD40 repeat protein/serine/threonine protein kinase